MVALLLSPAKRLLKMISDSITALDSSVIVISLGERAESRIFLTNSRPAFQCRS